MSHRQQTAILRLKRTKHKVAEDDGVETRSRQPHWRSLQARASPSCQAIRRRIAQGVWEELPVCALIQEMAMS